MGGGGSVTAKISIHHGDRYASLEGTADVIKWPNQSGWRSLWRPNGQLAQTWPQKAQEATTLHARTTPAVVDVKNGAVGPASAAAGLEQIQQVS